MNKREFLRHYRAEIDAVIRRALGNSDHRSNDTERWQWVLNNEDLYCLAKMEGVRV